MQIFRWLSILLVFAAIPGLALPGTAMALSYLNTEGLTIKPLLTTVDDPANHVVTSSSEYAGVAKIIVQFNDGSSFGGSASLLQSGGKQFLLTAAHMVSNGSIPPTLTAYFPGLTTSFSGVEYFVHPQWTGDVSTGVDIAIVKLNAPVSTTAYDILRTEITSPTSGYLAGYGASGLGSTGQNGSFGTLRQGQNTFGEYFWSFTGQPYAPYAYDFDNGQTNQNTILAKFGVSSDSGLGNNEVMIAPGDSGGPTFINGKIAGIHSFGVTYGTPYDIDNVWNSTFGELGGDTRVVAVTSWIDQTAVPLPGTAYLLATGLAVLLFWGNRQRSD